MYWFIVSLSGVGGAAGAGVPAHGAGVLSRAPVVGVLMVKVFSNPQEKGATGAPLNNKLVGI